MTKKVYSMTLDEEIFEPFQIYCDKNGFKVSSRVEVLMKNELFNLLQKQIVVCGVKDCFELVEDDLRNNQFKLCPKHRKIFEGGMNGS